MGKERRKLDEFCCRERRVLDVRHFARFVDLLLSLDQRLDFGGRFCWKATELVESRGAGKLNSANNFSATLANCGSFFLQIFEA